MTFTHERCDGNSMSNSFLDIITLNLRLSSLLKYRTCLDVNTPSLVIRNSNHAQTFAPSEQFVQISI